MIFLLSAFLFAVSGNAIFTENVFVKDFNGKAVNLKEIEITKDTVMVFIWCKTCGACVKRLNTLKNSQTRQIIAIAITENDSVEKEKLIIAKNNWTFNLYYDQHQNSIKYLVEKKYMKNYKMEGGKYRFGYPQIFMFVKDQFVCYSCDKFLPPLPPVKSK
jgi:hypothetical protein